MPTATGPTDNADEDQQLVVFDSASREDEGDLHPRPVR